MEKNATQNKQFGKRSVMIEPKLGSSQDQAEDAAFAAQKQRDLVLIERDNQKILDDQITKFLDAKYYIAEKTWFWLVGPTGEHYSVSRFYPELGVAVDTMVTSVNREQEIAFKRNTFKARGIRYGFLDYTMPLSRLSPQIGFPVKAA